MQYIIIVLVKVITVMVTFKSKYCFERKEKFLDAIIQVKCVNLLAFNRFTFNLDTMNINR